MLDYVREWIDAGGETLLTSMVDGPAELTARHLNEAYEKGDPLAIRAIEQMAKYLSAWIFDVYMLLNVDCIVFAGGLLAMGDKLMGRIREGILSHQRISGTFLRNGTWIRHMPDWCNGAWTR